MARGKKEDNAVAYDDNPLYAMEIKYVDRADGTRIGIVRTWMAFDPYYGPETEQQIEWHRRAGTKGAERWEVGKPVSGYGATKSKEPAHKIGALI